jgi:hypothetical protein
MIENRLRAFTVAVGLCIVLALPMMVSAYDEDYVFYDPFTNTYTVLPTGVDDAANLQDAFDAAVSTGPASTVQLLEGIYTISHTIHVVNFDGWFRGEGKGDTIIQTVNGFLPDLPSPEEPLRWPEVFLFSQDSECGATTIRVEDMSVYIVGSSALGIPLDVFGIYGKLTGVPDFEPSYLSVYFDRVEIRGERGIYPKGLGFWDSDSNVVWGIIVRGELIVPEDYRKPLLGAYSVTECDFKSIWYAMGFRLSDSTLHISHNTAEDVYAGLCDITDPSNTHVIVEDNYISSEAFGINIYHGYWTFFGGQPIPVPSAVRVSRNTIQLVDEDSWNAIHAYTFPLWSGETSELDLEISHNTIYAPGLADGIVLRDVSIRWFGLRSMNLVVSHNEIILENNVFGGIWASWIKDAVIANNLVSGTGDYGIDAFICDGLMLLGNNFQGFEAAPGEYGLASPIALEFCSYCTVVGGPSKTDVLEIGGHDNVFVGVNNMQGNAPGQDIADAMEQRRNMAALFRGH